MLSVEAAARHCPSPEYATARARFRKAAAQAGAAMAHHDNPNRGPDGGDLTTDVAWIGPSDAKCVIALVAGVHGVEGFCGSAAQLDWLENGGPQNLPEGMAAILIHAINPHGFAWQRRVTEENVDLNRNFVDFAQKLPENPGYGEVHDGLLPPSLDDAALKKAEEIIAAYKAKHGERAFQYARGGGQYTHADGFFYGGTAPTWSRQTLESILAGLDARPRQHVAVIDFHTGLGPYGYGEPICVHPVGLPAIARAKAWWGESVTETDAGTSVSTPRLGTAEIGWRRQFGDRFTYVALEFGTFSTERGRVVQRDDHMLHRRGPFDWHAPEARRTKAAIKRHYIPDTPDWWEMVLFRSRQMIRMGLAGLGTL